MTTKDLLDAYDHYLSNVPLLRNQDEVNTFVRILDELNSRFKDVDALQEREYKRDHPVLMHATLVKLGLIKGDK